MEKTYDVFISHSKEDSKLSVALCHYLEQNGLRCWIAPRDVTAGKDYAGCIIEAIQASRIMIVVFSEYSNKSHHVRNEVERAFNHNLAILPFRINDIIPAQSLEYFLGATHWLDALDGNAESYFDVLLRNCLLLIKGEVPIPPIPTPNPTPVPGPRPFPQPVPKPTKKGLNIVAFAVGIVALIVVVIISIHHFGKPGSGWFSSDNASILFKNNTNTPIYINVNNVKDTIRVDSTFKFTGDKNGKVTGRAETYWVDGEGHPLGKLLHWNIDTTFNSTGSYYYNLNIFKYFLLRVINTSNTPTSSVSVMYNYDYSLNQNVSISVPNDGKVYPIGYFDINNYITIRVTGQNGYQKDFSANASTFGDDRNRWVNVTFR